MAEVIQLSSRSKKTAPNPANKSAKAITAWSQAVAKSGSSELPAPKIAFPDLRGCRFRLEALADNTPGKVDLVSAWVARLGELVRPNSLTPDTETRRERYIETLRHAASLAELPWMAWSEEALWACAAKHSEWPTVPEIIEAMKIGFKARLLERDALRNGIYQAENKQSVVKITQPKRQSWEERKGEEIRPFWKEEGRSKPFPIGWSGEKIFEWCAARDRKVRQDRFDARKEIQAESTASA